jgi:polyketide cyclase/dehydrase/lipid transport protein
MASIRKEIVIDAPGAAVWDAIQDVGALHTRLVPGFVVDTRLEGESRVVTFGNGATVRERIVDRDDSAWRLVWTIVGGRFDHHNGALQVLGEPGGGCRVVWIADLLPHELAIPVAAVMEQGLEVMRRTLEAAAGPGRGGRHERS